MPVFVLNGTTEVEVAYAPPGSRVQIPYLDFFNADTADVTILVKIYDNQGTARTRRQRTISPNNEAIAYDSTNGPAIENGERMVAVMSAAPATTQPTGHINVR